MITQPVEREILIEYAQNPNSRFNGMGSNFLASKLIAWYNERIKGHTEAELSLGTDVAKKAYAEPKNAFTNTPCNIWTTDIAILNQNWLSTEAKKRNISTQTLQKATQFASDYEKYMNLYNLFTH